METFNALWIDDVRHQPENCDKYIWTRARSFHEAVTKLELLDFDHVSFDHDLASFYGSKEMTGYDIALWLAERKINTDEYIPSSYAIHSANPVGRDNIKSVIQRYLQPDFTLH